MDREMNPGERVEVRLNGFEADEWLAATVTGKARKQEVTLDEHPFGREPFTYQADETNIAEWRPLADQTLPACFADDDGPEELDQLPAPPRKTIPAADRELLELAARALGAVHVEEVEDEGYLNLHMADGSIIYAWNSLVHSDDTFNLAADLELDIMHRIVGGRRIEVLAAGGPLIQEFYEGDRKCAIRRAVTRAAAESGKSVQ